MRTNGKALVLAMAVSGIAALSMAQDAVHQVRFDVVSVKANKSGGPLTFHSGPGMFSVSNETVMQVITGAYHVQDFQVLGGPSWIGSDRFDIQGKFDQPAPGVKTSVDLMLRGLLSDRFRLEMHQESRQLRAYELSIAPKGAGKLKRAEEAQATNNARGNRDGAEAPVPPPVTARFRAGGVIAPNMQIEALVRFLSVTLRARVIDKSGLTGQFNVELNWMPDIGERSPFGEVSPSTLPGGPSLFTALDESGLSGLCG